MKNCKRAVLIGLAFGGLAPLVNSAAFAETVITTTGEAARAANGYEDLYAAIQGGIDEQVMLDRMITSIGGQLATSSPAMIQAEASFPGYSAAMAQAMGPVLALHSKRLQQVYRPRMIGVFTEILTEPEASDAAEIYRSPVGRKLLSGVVAGFDGKAMLSDAVQGGDVSTEAVRTDTHIAVTRSVNGLSKEDLAQLEQLARTKPVILKLGKLGERGANVRAEMENEPMTPDEEAMMDRAINAAAKAHIAKFKK
jgi:hypothetical protein